MKTICLALSLCTILLASCSGSDTYRGDWKATDPDGTHYDIHFDAENFSITMEGERKEFVYSQNQINISNGVETYGITLDDGRTCQIHFPIASDESVGVMYDGAGQLIFTISRHEYLTYEDAFGLH